MLRVYTRHYPPCRQTDSYRRCRCPKWINGLLPTGEFVRVSAKTRSWETAGRKARLMEANADPLRQSPPEAGLRITIKDAVKAFLQDEEARQLAKTTTGQSKTLLEQQLLTWAKSQSLMFLVTEALAFPARATGGNMRRTRRISWLERCPVTGPNRASSLVVLSVFQSQTNMLLGSGAKNVRMRSA